MKSTTTTTINSTHMKNGLKFSKDEVGLKFNSSYTYDFSIMKKFKKDEPRLIDLVSDQPKVLIDLTTSFYHLYHDCFGELLTQYELTPNAKFLINVSHIKEIDELPEYIKMIFKFLNHNNIDYRPIDLNANPIININNLYYRDSSAESFAINHPAKRLYNFSQQYIVDKNIEATKMVYLSRKNFIGRDLSFFIKGNLPYENDDRIDDEKKLEDYFSSIGFEIIYPDEFKTFEEQMNFFYQVKTVASLTSSGLTNTCFMRPGSKVIEISTPLISFSKLGNGVTDSGSRGQEELHHFYAQIGTAMDHTYLAIPNMLRSSESIIERIEKDIALKSFLIG
jgi:hypothetical protein